MTTAAELQAAPAVEPDSSKPETAEPVPGSSSLALGQSAADAGDDAELEHGFFSRGLSEDALQAVSESEGERDFLHQPVKAGRRRKISLAACGVLVAVAVAFGVRGFFTERDLRPQALEPMASVKQAPAAAPTPQKIEAMPLELVPPTPVPRIVDISQLRARGLVGPVPPPEEAAPAEAPAQPEPTAEELAAAETPLPQPSTQASAMDGKAVTATSTQPVGAVAAAEQQKALAACNDVLHSAKQSTKYREIETKCKAAFAAAPAAELAAGVAQAALENGRNADAVAWARKAIDVNPKLAQAFVLLGGAEQQLGHAQQARDAYNRYLELAPNGEHAQDIRALLPSLGQ
jgi:tetratricopeptide (TPR) repeat protein